MIVGKKFTTKIKCASSSKTYIRLRKSTELSSYFCHCCFQLLSVSFILNVINLSNRDIYTEIQRSLKYAVCVCVCVSERERESERASARGGEMERVFQTKTNCRWNIIASEQNRSDENLIGEEGHRKSQKATQACK